MLLEFKIKKKEITKINKQYVKKNDAYNKCKFYFDRETYQDKELFVTFINKYGYSQILSLGKWQEVLSCSVPKRFLQDSYFKIFTHAKQSFKTNTISIILNDNCIAEPKKPQKVLDFVLADLKKKIDSIVFEDNQLKCYSDNDLIDTIFIDNVDEALVKEQIQIHFEELEGRINEKIDKCLTANDITFQDGIIYINK